jgi:hypothetical protein
MLVMLESTNTYPSQIYIDGELYNCEKVLKADFFSTNILYKNDTDIRYVLKISGFNFALGFLLGFAARFFSSREYAIYSSVADIKGVPPLGPRFGRRGYLHKYIDGKTLFEISSDDTIPDDFFLNLKNILDELHRRRIFYMDLNKRGNIIMGIDGLPYLIDFQICIRFRDYNGFFRSVYNRIFKKLIKEDIYHLYKHKKRFRPDLMTEEELLLARRTGLNTWIDRLIGRPYRKVKRLIYPAGSNEVIWYKWKREKDRTKQMP